MITLPACAWLPSSLLSSFSLSLSCSPSRFPPARIPGGHPLSAAMLPGNMIIVIICTLLRSYPPDSSPLRNGPVILPAWLPPFSLSPFLHSSPFLSFSLFLLRSIPAVVPSCVMLHSSLLCTLPSRHADLFPPPTADSPRHPATPFSRTPLPLLPRSPCVDLSPLPPADELRGNEREQGRSNRPLTETTFLSRPPFVFRRASASSSLSSLFLSSSPFSCGCPENFTMRNAIPCVALFGSLFLYLPFRPPSVSLFIFLVVTRGPTFFPSPTCARFLFRSLLLPRSSFPRAVHSNSSLRKRFIDRHSRLFSFGLFLASSNFSRVSNIGVIFQRAKIPRENCRAVRIKYRCSRSI